MLQVSQPHLGFLFSQQGPWGQGPHQLPALPVKKTPWEDVRWLGPSELQKEGGHTCQRVGQHGPVTQVPASRRDGDKKPNRWKTIYLDPTQLSSGLCRPMACAPGPVCSLGKSLTPVVTQCPAYLISWLAIPARGPVRSSKALRALSPYHAPGPWQPLQPLEVQKKLVKPSQEDMETGGDRGAVTTHLSPPPA